jgi:hypothetical protein
MDLHRGSTLDSFREFSQFAPPSEHRRARGLFSEQIFREKNFFSHSPPVWPVSTAKVKQKSRLGGSRKSFHDP